MSIVIKLMLGGVLIGLAACSHQENSGNSMETENSLAVQVLQGDDKPLARAQVSIRPLWYVANSAEPMEDSLFLCDTQTDAKGWGRCPGLTAGAYVVQVLGDTLGAHIEILYEKRAQGEVHALKAVPLGSLQGQVELPLGTSSAQVSIYGTDLTAQTNERGEFSMVGVPAGVLRVLARTEEQVLGEQKVQVESTVVTQIGTLPPPTLANEDPLTWRYRQSIPLHTLVADWMGSLQGPVVLTLRLDSLFPYAQALPDGRDLRIRSAQGELLPMQRRVWEPELGRAVLRLQVPADVWVKGQDLELWWGRMSALDASQEWVGEGVSDSLWMLLQSVLIDDFEANRPINALLPPLQGHYWYIRSSDSTVTVHPRPDEDVIRMLVPADSGRAGSAARLIYSAPKYQWVLLGCGLGSRPHSLRSMDSLEFWARGSGLISVALENLRGAGGKALHMDTLTTHWKRYRVRPQDFLPASGVGKNLGWSVVQDSITNLTFFGSEGTEVWLDDIRIYGINRDDLKE